MKSLSRLFLLLITCVVLQNPAWGADACQPQACNNNENNETLSVFVGGSRVSGLCFGCEWGDDAHECDENAVVGQKVGDFVQKVFVCAGASWSGWHWDDISASTSWCSNSEVKPSSFESGTNYDCGYSFDGGTTLDYSSTVPSCPSGCTPCKACKCKSGMTPNSDKTDCIAGDSGGWDEGGGSGGGDGGSDGGGDGGDGGTPPEPPADPLPDCIRTGGTKSADNKQCLCTGTGMKQSSDTKTCQCDTDKRYIPVPGTGDSDSNPLQCQIDYETGCKATGGKWNESANECECPAPGSRAKHVQQNKPDKKVCECVQYYEWIDENNKYLGCKPTDAIENLKLMKQACVAEGSWGKWDDKRHKCQCAGNNMTYNGFQCVCITANFERDYANRNCRKKQCSEVNTLCNKLVKQGVPVTPVYYNHNSCSCDCIDRNKELKDIGEMGVPDWQCVSRNTPSSPSGKSGGASSETKDTKTEKNVAIIRNDLKSMESGFKTSVWKNADGQFNTARLASDSIAGVVLGTAGGLITSNIIKKNQVSGGFENVRCTIGGQVVAGYGDLFRVGVR